MYSVLALRHEPLNKHESMLKFKQCEGLNQSLAYVVQEEIGCLYLASEDMH